MGGGPIAKALLPLSDVPLFVYPLRTLCGVHDLGGIVLVVPADHQAQAAEMVAHYGPWPFPVEITAGGAERQDSVAAGLSKLDTTTDLVIIHDAARPFVSLACLSACVAAATLSGAAIAALPATDTVKLVANDAVIRTLERQSVWLAQTPQVFRPSLLRQAYAAATRDGYAATDDAALVERIGTEVLVVPGESTNRKITTPDDLRWAEWYVATHSAAQNAP